MGHPPRLPPQLRAWCRLRGKSAPPLRGTAWASALPKTARFFDQQRVRKVIGLSASKGGEGVTVSHTWYALEFLTVAVHFVFCFAPPALLIGYALTVQHIYGLHLSPIAPDAPALTLLAAVQPYPTAPPSATSSLIAFRAALWGSIGMMGMSVFRLLFSYLDLQGSKKNAAPGCSSVVGYAVRSAYAIALMVSMSVVFAWPASSPRGSFSPPRSADALPALRHRRDHRRRRRSDDGVHDDRGGGAAQREARRRVFLMLKHRLKGHEEDRARGVPRASSRARCASQWEDADVEAGGAAAAAAAWEEAKEKEVTRPRPPSSNRAPQPRHARRPLSHHRRAADLFTTARQRRPLHPSRGPASPVYG